MSHSLSSVGMSPARDLALALPDTALSDTVVADTALASSPLARSAEGILAPALRAYLPVEGGFRTAEDVQQAIGQLEGVPRQRADTALVPSELLASAFSSATSASSSASSSGICKQEFRGMEGSSLLELFRADPDKFADLMKSLKPHDRQLVTMRLQEEMQSQNQIFSLISNLQQSDHQTSKSIISNIRA